MKKWIAVLLAVLMLLSMSACGSINNAEVSILWSGDGKVHVPNSLINAMERAMYTQSIDYTHYGANADAATQLTQAETALNTGCAALAVELIEPENAQTILDLAKAKDVPVVFFNCLIGEEILSSYDKAFLVRTDLRYAATAQGDMIALYLKDNFKKLDRNGDGSILYAGIGDTTATVAAANNALSKDALPALQAAATDLLIADVLAQFNDATNNMVELIITENDTAALEVLSALQAIGYNDTKLNTHCIPVFTMGADVDARAFTDTSDMDEDELAVFIYNAMNLIDAGKLAGTVLENYDAIAAAVAQVLRNRFKGDDVTQKLDTITQDFGPQYANILYTTYTG